MTSPLEELGLKISTEIATITKLLQATGVPSPSFAESSAVDISKSPQSAAEQDTLLNTARNKLINAAQDVLRLAQGPVDHIVTLAYAVRSVLSISTPPALPSSSYLTLPVL